MGFVPETVEYRNVLPMDLIGYDTDLPSKGGIPCVVQIPPIRMVSELHLIE